MTSVLAENQRWVFQRTSDCWASVHFTTMARQFFFCVYSFFTFLFYLSSILWIIWCSVFAHFSFLKLNSATNKHVINLSATPNVQLSFKCMHPPHAHVTLPVIIANMSLKKVSIVNDISQVVGNLTALKRILSLKTLLCWWFVHRLSQQTVLYWWF